MADSDPMNQAHRNPGRQAFSAFSISCCPPGFKLKRSVNIDLIKMRCQSRELDFLLCENKSTDNAVTSVNSFYPVATLDLNVK